MVRLLKLDDTRLRARSNRGELSKSEQNLWRMLRDRRLIGAKFRRQVALGDYVVDFVCMDAKLVVELDGPEHERLENAAFDARRTQHLEAAGFRVVRLRNDDLILHREAALTAIVQALRNPSPLVGEGGLPRSGKTDERC